MARSTETRRLLTSTRQLIERVRQQSGLAYADDTWSPISDITLDLVARRFNGAIVVDELGAHTQEIGIPGYLGPPMIVVNRFIQPGFRRLALRHGLGHLVAGELDAGEGSEVRFMSSILDHSTFEERRADLFALSDLIPDRQIDAVLLDGRPAPAVQRWLTEQVRIYAPDWLARRVRDRVRLRMALYEDRR